MGGIVGKQTFFLCFQFFPLLVQAVYFIFFNCRNLFIFFAFLFLFQFITTVVDIIHFFLNRCNSCCTFSIFIIQNLFD